MAVIGIDLGTTSSCVSAVQCGQAEVIVNSERRRTTPSVVAFSKEGERLVGDVALRQQALNPERTVSSVKRHMGSGWRFKCNGKAHSPQEISAMILRKLKKDAESYLGGAVTSADRAELVNATAALRRSMGEA